MPWRRGEVTGSQLKAPPGGVSKRMLVVIVLMLVVIVVPVAVIGLPTSKIVVTVTNVDDQIPVYVRFRMWGVVDEIDSFLMDPEEIIVYEYRVAIGDYYISASVDYYGENHTYQMVTRSGSVSLFETEQVTLTLGPW